MSKNLPNWPNLELSYRERLKRVVIPSVVKALSKVPFFKSRFETLRWSFDTDYTAKSMNGKKPATLEAGINSLIFVDLFRFEEFGALAAGLQRLSNAYKGRRFRHPEDFFTQFERYKSGEVGGWALFDDIDLSESGDTSLLDGMTLHIYSISPSFMMLAIIVEPSKKFDERLQHIFAAPFPEQRKFKWSILWSKGWRVTRVSQSSVRGLEFKKLCIAANKEVVGILHEYLRCGWSGEGRPLPTIEIFTHSSGSDALEELHEEDHFWSSMGVEDFLAYRDGAITICRPHMLERERSRYESYKVRVDRKAFGYKPNTGYQSEDSAIRFRLILDALPGYFVYVALKEYLESMQRSTMQLRETLAPSLIRQHYPLFRLPRFDTTQNIARLNRLKFEIKRIAAEMDTEAWDVYPINDLRNFSSKIKDDKTSTLYEDAARELKSTWNSAHSQLTLIREHYTDQFNFGMQRKVLFLTWVTLFLAALSVPEAFWMWAYGILTASYEFLRSLEGT